MSVFLDIFLNLRFSRLTIFEETLPDFIREENTHPKGGERKEQCPIKKRGPMSNQEMAKMTLP